MYERVIQNAQKSPFYVMEKVVVLRGNFNDDINWF